MKWTKKDALERTRNNQELREVLAKYPPVNHLVRSAMRLKRYPGYHKASCHYAYKDWLYAIFGDECTAFYVCLYALDDLLPRESRDGPMIYAYNPVLPGLPMRPRGISEPIYIGGNGTSTLKTYTEEEILESGSLLERERHRAMRKMLSELPIEEVVNEVK